MTTNHSKDKEIDYTAEGSDPGSSKPPSPTDRGYDEAANRGSTYGTPEGEGGVFGTTGGGTYGGGMQIEERPLVYDDSKKRDLKPGKPDKV
jgi:hypothetical protein